MQEAKSRLVILVHGWSVRSTDTYGELPDRLETEARHNANLRLDIRNIWLSKYISFSDSVSLDDLSRAFDAAIRRELGPLLKSGRRFVCITHSTGAPVVRNWWQRYYLSQPVAAQCPMSHLIMLAPPNFGSALAQLGKSRVSRLKAWFQGVEPGQGILDWLELGSSEAWMLNQSWIAPANPDATADVYLFVLTGQTIDRKLYDHINTYTGEMGSDGVVRTAAANLNATYLRIEQDIIEQKTKLKQGITVGCTIAKSANAKRTVFTLVRGVAHSGEDKGILRSIKDNQREHPTVKAILDCLNVSSQEEYVGLCNRFEQQTEDVQDEERIETEVRQLLPNRVFIHDAHAMLIIRVRDDQGSAVSDFDLKFTATKWGAVSPDYLPTGLIVDRQLNHRQPGILTFYLNHHLLIGTAPLREGKRVFREARKGAAGLGLQIVARPAEGFVHYASAELNPKTQSLKGYIKPHQTTLIDVILRRIVRSGTFGLTKMRKSSDFTETEYGEVVT
jgi:hypothetical protein